MTTVNVALRTRTRTTIRAAASGYCTPTPSGTFFPVAPGTTLPAAPTPTTNVAPLPPNATTAPEGWNPAAPDLCWLFQDILPVSTAPVYPTELTPAVVYPPYLETVALDARVRMGLGISAYPYDLTPVTVSVPLRTRTRIEVAPAILIPAGTPPTITLSTFAPTIAAGASISVPAATITLTTYAPYEPEAASYITRVEAVDGSALESGVRDAINAFILGCKADGTWNAIKASCILAGARTLNGALVPLVGTAPTNVNFVSGDYNRKTGLIGNGSNKYLDSNRAANADPESNTHVSVYVSALHPSGTAGALIGSGTDSGGNDETVIESNALDSPNRYAFRLRNDGTLNQTSSSQQVGFVGASRSSSSGYTARFNGSDTSITQTAQGSSAFNYYVFAVNRANSAIGPCSARLSFYSIGESLNMASLDSRLTTLLSAYTSAIP